MLSRGALHDAARPQVCHAGGLRRLHQGPTCSAFASRTQLYTRIVQRVGLLSRSLGPHIRLLERQGME